MIELPARPAPSSFGCALLDFGFTQEGLTDLRVDRPGGRHRVTLGWPPLEPDDAAQLLALLKRGKRLGVRARLPLRRPQGLPGVPVVDGAGQAGTQLALRGLTPGYVARADYWLTLVEADGTAHLHSVSVTAVAGTDGRATLQIEPPLRAPFADATRVELAAPFVEGALEGEAFAWEMSLQRRDPLSISLREAQ